MPIKNKEFGKILRQRIHHLILEIINLTSGFDWRDELLIVIKKQIIRSSTSIGANYIEAIAASSNRDFFNYLNYALKSANETQYWFVLLLDAGKIAKFEATARNLLKENNEISQILAASVRTLREKNKRSRS